MRELASVTGLRSEEILAHIEAPARFRPQPRLVRPIPWRTNPDGSSEIHLEGRGWKPMLPYMAEVHRGLEAGDLLDALVARVLPCSPRPDERTTARIVREYVLQLSELGFVEIPFEPPPDLFAGRYRRLRELGRGGIGIVHLCRDERTGSEVVVKHAWGWNKDIAKAERHMRSEALVFAALDHPGFPRLVDTFEDRGNLHVVRECVQGTPLSDLERETPSWPSWRRRALVADLADALHHMHERGFLCLDVKTGNILVTDAGRPVAFDLGAARPNPPGGVRLAKPTGSPGYAAPEVKRDRIADPRSDEYSLGCLLFALAYGRRPKRTWRHDAILAAMDEAGIDPVERALIARMTEADPARRFPTLAAARDALRA